jgi:hypothetical protein
MGFETAVRVFQRHGCAFAVIRQKSMCDATILNFCSKLWLRNYIFINTRKIWRSWDRESWYISTVKPIRCTIFEFIEYRSTCFGRSFSPSLGVQDCTHSIRYTSMSYMLFDCLLVGTRCNCGIMHYIEASSEVLNPNHSGLTSFRCTTQLSTAVRSTFGWEHYHMLEYIMLQNRRT